MSCGSRPSYENQVPWTWQDGRLLALSLCLGQFFSSKIIKQIVFSCHFFPLVGTIGAFLNCLVLIGVGGNARLGTTVNRLLTWICVIALMESTVGITVKSLILG